MTKASHTTKLSFDVLQARLSLHETQNEFAARFRVSRGTINKWENGVVEQAQRIYKEILESLRARLKREGRLMPDEAIYPMFKPAPEKEEMNVR